MGMVFLYTRFFFLIVKRVFRELFVYGGSSFIFCFLREDFKRK